MTNSHRIAVIGGDGIGPEVTAEARRITDGVQTGELGARALETRRRQAGDLRDKVLLYEDLLAVGLAGLHEAVSAAGQAAASAALLIAAAAPEAEPIAAG